MLQLVYTSMCTTFLEKRLSHCTVAEHRTVIRRPEFYNQMEPVWTVKTTNRGSFKCELDMIEEIKPLSISYKRCTFFRGRRCDFQTLGILDAVHTDRMTIFHKGTFQRVERLLFMTVDHACGVFKVESLTDWSNFYYDLRLINSSAYSLPSERCRRYFRRVAGNQPSFYIYSPRCQGLYRQHE
ncbi:uncharacterized protein LOC142771409 [Rhipicephalus microplus]|uniref:uncharacterized protein LOC142771409 n=1 Tax=Rhipicephalus microplus TaxID=6941 RepID=UPI003F6BA3D2